MALTDPLIQGGQYTPASAGYNPSTATQIDPGVGYVPPSAASVTPFAIRPGFWASLLDTMRGGDLSKTVAGLNAAQNQQMMGQQGQFAAQNGINGALPSGVAQMLTPTLQEALAKTQAGTTSANLQNQLGAGQLPYANAQGQAGAISDLLRLASMGTGFANQTTANQALAPGVASNAIAQQNASTQKARTEDEEQYNQQQQAMGLGSTGAPYQSGVTQGQAGMLQGGDTLDMLRRYGIDAGGNLNYNPASGGYEARPFALGMNNLLTANMLRGMGMNVNSAPQAQSGGMVFPSAEAFMGRGSRVGGGQQGIDTDLNALQNNPPNLQGQAQVQLGDSNMPLYQSQQQPQNVQALIQAAVKAALQNQNAAKSTAKTTASGDITGLKTIGKWLIASPKDDYTTNHSIFGIPVK